MRLTAALLCLGLAAMPGPAMAQACGTPEGECHTANGLYRLVLPSLTVTRARRRG